MLAAWVACQLLATPDPAAVWVRADPEGVGSGWVVDARKRWVVTCRHVVGERKSVEVFFPPPVPRGDFLGNRPRWRAAGRLVTGRVVRVSDAADLALIELESLPPGTRAWPLGPAPRLGDPLTLVGSRHDLDTLNNVATGVLRQSGHSADGYFWGGAKLGVGAESLLVQMPVAEGESGGPVIDADGRVVGVLAARRGPAAAVAIAAPEVRRFLDVREPGPQAKREPTATERLAAATAWVRPTATAARTAGVLIDGPQRLLLSSAAAGQPGDRLAVAFPLAQSGQVVGERAAYRDPVALVLAGVWCEGTVIAADPGRDLALIRLDRLPPGVCAMPLAPELPRLGEGVQSVGHPPGLEWVWAASAGSLRQRGHLSLAPGGRGVRAAVWQSPASPAASGAGLVNAAGELLGVTSRHGTADGQTAFSADPGEVRAFLAEAPWHRLAADLRPWLHSRRWLAMLWLGASRPDLAAHADPTWALPLRVMPTLGEPECDRLLTLDPSDARALLTRAKRLEARRDYRPAAADLARLLAQTPQNAVAQRRLGRVWAAANDHPQALAAWRNAVRLSVTAWPGIAADVLLRALQLAAGDPGAAGEFLREAGRVLLTQR